MSSQAAAHRDGYMKSLRWRRGTKRKQKNRQYRRVLECDLAEAVVDADSGPTRDARILSDMGAEGYYEMDFEPELKTWRDRDKDRRAT